MDGAPWRLRCEYRNDPLGIDVARPRLSWCVGDGRPAELQTAYQLLAASHPDILAEHEGDLWDPGRAEGSETSQIEYAGKPLVSGRGVWWKVRCFDSDGLPSPWSEIAFFEAGLLTADDWQGRWIRAGLVGSRIDPVPVPLFGRRFSLPGPARRARLYVAARGQVAIQMNGTRLALGELAPNWIAFETRSEYLTLDVTAHLWEGDNDLGVLLADGWYSGDPGSGSRQQYGKRPEFIAELDISLEGGERRRLCTDSAWRWQPSWILASDPTRGERVDGTRARAVWIDGEGPEAFGWYPVETGARPADEERTPAAASPVAHREAPLEARLLRWREADLTALFELPRPVLGRAKVELTAPDGGALKVRYGLSLDEAGKLAAAGEDAYVALGEESGETFEALFSLHGFRYVELTGDLFRQESARVSAVPIVQPLEKTATLVCDHAGVNALLDSMNAHLEQTQQSVSMAGLAVRDRLGVVADFGVRAGSLLLGLDAAPLVLRWLRDMADTQFPSGAFPAVVPPPPGEDALAAEGPAGSSDAFVEVLWQLYRHCGDRRLLRQYFPAVKQMLAGSLAQARDFIREDLDSSEEVPGDLVATAWLYRSARIASRLAGVLGNLSDLEDCEELASSVRSAFRRRFVTPDGRVIGDSAPSYALTLGFGLLDPTEQLRARESLIDMVELGLARGTVTALLDVPALLRVLTDQGRLDLAYRIVLEADFAPTPELGGSDLGRLIGAGVHEWLHATLSGLQPSRDLSERQNAFRRVLIHPRPPLGMGTGVLVGEPPIREAEAKLTTMNGLYESRWRITDEAFEIRVLVPGNCSADVVLPDGTSHAVEAGQHVLGMAFGEAGDGIPVLREVS